MYNESEASFCIRKMKLLISAYACIPNRGSEPGNGWHYAQGNTDAGNEVWCLTTPEGKEAIQDHLKNHPDPGLHFLFLDVPVWLNYLYRFQPFVYLHYLVWQYKAVKAARTLDRQVDFDLIHHVTLASLQLGSGLWKLKKPFIFGPVGGGNVAPKAFKAYFFGHWSAETVRKITSQLLVTFNPYFKKTMAKADLILAANSETMAIARKAGAQQVKLFLDTSLSAAFLKENESFTQKKTTSILKILWVGRIFPRKGLLLVLEALSRLKGSVPFHLTILGDSKYGYWVPQWLKNFELEDAVTWKGQVPWAEVMQAYGSHDVFMFCSLRDSFGSQFLEAMASGLPIITLNHHGAKDHIPEKAAIKVSVDNPEQTLLELTEAVKFLYMHPWERIQMGAKGRQFATTHEWKPKIAALNMLYRQISQKGASIAQASTHKPLTLPSEVPLNQ